MARVSRQHQTVTIRMPRDLIAALDAMAEQAAQSQGIELNRSTTIRLILRRATGEPRLKAMLAEELAVFQSQLGKRMGRVNQLVKQVLERDLVAAYMSPGDDQALPEGDVEEDEQDGFDDEEAEDDEHE